MKDEHDNEITIPGPYKNIQAIRNKNRDEGYHFFTAGAMRFFASKIGRATIYGRFFITSEQFRGSDVIGRRMYTIRIAKDDGTIGRLGKNMQFRERADARAYLEKKVADALALSSR